MHKPDKVSIHTNWIYTHSILMVDKFPQWMNLTQIVLNSTTIVVSETVAPKLGENEAMEVLKVQYDAPMTILASQATLSNDEANELLISIVQGSNPGTTLMVFLNDQRCIDHLHKKEESQYAETTETGGGPVYSPLVHIHDFTDGGGRGFLISTERVFMQGQGSNANMVQTQRARILWRAVKVTASELLQLSRQ